LYSNGWGASAVDAFSTALVMQNQDVVNIILDYVPTIDWGVSYQNEQVSLFETTIRYLAGILSAYDLLNGPLASLAKNASHLNKPSISAVTYLATEAKCPGSARAGEASRRQPILRL
jgi:mannosyl-oligosaccharide alpha-1,2-mannosidase